MQPARDIFSDADTTYSEDCLYLNVWNAEYPARSRKPVMLWIHGGGNNSGHVGQKRFDGEKLSRHVVVVVTSNSGKHCLQAEEFSVSCDREAMAYWIKVKLLFQLDIKDFDI